MTHENQVAEGATCFYSCTTRRLYNEILIRSTFRRGKKPLLVATLTAIAFAAFVCFIVLPAVALLPLAISVRHERLSRPPQPSVPVVVGLDYKTAQIKLRDANLKFRILANRHEPNLEPGLIIAQVPQGGERVDCGTVIGVTVSADDPWC